MLQIKYSLKEKQIRTYVLICDSHMVTYIFLKINRKSNIYSGNFWETFLRKKGTGCILNHRLELGL